MVTVNVGRKRTVMAAWLATGGFHNAANALAAHGRHLREARLAAERISATPSDRPQHTTQFLGQSMVHEHVL